jgi:glycosyltransferase involved in cell wall biosynthesis
MLRICHISTAHRRDDVRIFLKECQSLAALASYAVHFVVADSKSDEIKNDINIHDVGASSGRLDRMIFVADRAFKKAIELNCNIYHLHDPELIPIGLKLKKRGKIVIFDAHEDVPKQILGKSYINKHLRSIIAYAFELYEDFSASKFDAIVAATPFIRDKFLKLNPNSVDINNFPLLSEFPLPSADVELRKSVCYVGGIAAFRGIRENVRAMDFVESKATLEIAGKFSESAVSSEMRGFPGWSRVKELGHIGRAEVQGLLARSFAGLVTFHPQANHISAQPNKMFEYMSAGVPVICSDFPLWRDIVVGNDCGICVDPMDPREIAQAIDYLANNPQRVLEMGLNGRRAVETKYNWGIEEQKLLGLYKTLAKTNEVDYA